MKPRAALATFALALAFAPVSLATSTGHEHAALKPAPQQFASAAKPSGGWTTDAPLRAGMGRIRESVDALEHYKRGHMGADQALVLAGSIEKDVAYLVANCKLDPAADAALHGIIAKLLKGTGALKQRPDEFAAIDTMREAVAEYGRIFNDPGFRKASPR